MLINKNKWKTKEMRENQSIWKALIKLVTGRMFKIRTRTKLDKTEGQLQQFTVK